ncbi:MAG: dipicolinate synthase subunit B [Christensenellaceae bacterium]|jgi:dipicolinate synthase subunit B|nr:dipicolinate synthase subunit B [Christensenellaceae bacterium]
MDFVIKLNKNSSDTRVKILSQIFADNGYEVFDIADEMHKKTIFFFEPRFEISCNMFSGALNGSIAFGYAKSLPECLCVAGVKYVCLSEDETFIAENNRLTALALKQIIESDFGNVKQKMLVCGWGKLATQIEKVFDTADLHILDFNIHKRPELIAKYGNKSFFAVAPTEKFPIIINTIPKELLQVGSWKKRKGQVIYELASPPYGVDWSGCAVNWLDKEHTTADIDCLPPSLNKNNTGGHLSSSQNKNQTGRGESPPQNKIQSGEHLSLLQNKKQQSKTHFARYRILPALPGKYYPREAGQAVYDCITRYLAAIERNTIVLCITGSACSYLKLIPILRELAADFDIIPVISENANQPNRFTNIEEFRNELREITGHNIVTNIAGAETLSANKKIRATVIFPATGNTLAKLTHAITDTPVLMAVKAQLRNGKPCIIGISTNDALAGNAKNIGELLNRKNIYFVPFGQDDIVNKPFSMICDFTKVGETIKKALNGEQLQPILLK